MYNNNLLKYSIAITTDKVLIDEAEKITINKEKLERKGGNMYEQPRCRKMKD